MRSIVVFSSLLITLVLSAEASELSDREKYGEFLSSSTAKLSHSGKISEKTPGHVQQITLNGKEFLNEDDDWDDILFDSDNDNDSDSGSGSDGATLDSSDNTTKDA